MNWNRRQQGLKRVRRLMSVYRARVWNRTERLDYYAYDGPLAQTLLRTRVRCSGPCCGNQRRHFGLVTRQERLAPTVPTVQEYADVLAIAKEGQ